MGNNNYLFYMFVFVIMITFLIWLYIVYNQKEPKEEVFYEYVEEDQVDEPNVNFESKVENELEKN